MWDRLKKLTRKYATGQDLKVSPVTRHIVNMQTSGLTAFDDQILTLRAKGLTTGNMAEIFAEMYGVQVSPCLISKVTDAIWETVQTWSLEAQTVYPRAQVQLRIVHLMRDALNYVAYKDRAARSQPI